MSVLDSNSLKYEIKEFTSPSLEELCPILQEGLQLNFAEVNCEIVDCPDLSKGPFYLADKGLSGNESIVEFGSPVYLLPTVDRSKVYDIIPMIRRINGYEKDKNFFICGAGAGPWPLFSQNCEGILNLSISNDGSVINETHVARTITREQIELSKVPKSETRCALLGNIFLCEGKQGKVIKINAKVRKGDENFISAMRLALTRHFGEDSNSQIVGLGGVFQIKCGKAKQHVMDDFSKIPLNTEEELNRWLTFHEHSAPLIAVGTFVSQECDLDLRLQHFHSFSMHNEGGHYHYDTTPDIVEYEGYFNIGHRIVRIDKPTVSDFESFFCLF
jgi:hypothetical protein